MGFAFLVLSRPRGKIGEVLEPPFFSFPPSPQFLDLLLNNKLVVCISIFFSFPVRLVFFVRPRNTTIERHVG